MKNLVVLLATLSCIGCALDHHQYGNTIQFKGASNFSFAVDDRFVPVGGQGPVKDTRIYGYYTFEDKYDSNVNITLFIFQYAGKLVPPEEAKVAAQKTITTLARNELAKRKAVEDGYSGGSFDNPILDGYEDIYFAYDLESDISGNVFTYVKLKDGIYHAHIIKRIRQYTIDLVYSRPQKAKDVTFKSITELLEEMGKYAVFM